MERLPTEIFIHILDYVPTSTCATARLTCRSFNAILARRLFRVLVSFMDPVVAKETINEIVRDPLRRPRSIWSPDCLVPEQLIIPGSYLMALWAGLQGSSWGLAPDGSIMQIGETDADSRLTVETLKSTFGRPELTERMLREAVFRYSLYLSYIRRADNTQAPYKQVLGTLLSVRNMLMLAGISKW